MQARSDERLFVILQLVFSSENISAPAGYATNCKLAGAGNSGGFSFILII